MKRLFIFLLIFLFQFIQPSFALLNSSLQSSVGVEVLAYEAGTLSVAAPAAVTSTLSAGGSTISGTFIGGGVAVLGAAGLGLYGVSTNAASQLQNKAISKVCSASNPPSFCGGQVMIPVRGGCNGEGGSTSVPFSVWNSSDGDSRCSSGAKNVIGGGIYFGESGNATLLQVGPSYTTSATPWNQLTDAQRAAALAALNGSDISDLVTRAGTIPLSAIDTANVAIQGTNILGSLATSLANGIASYLNSLNGGCPTTLPNPYCTCNGGSGGNNSGAGAGNSPGDGNGDDDDDGKNNNDGCSALQPFETDASPNTFVQVANALAGILPQTPNNMRLPTLISNMGGQGSLAGNLALELYSASWQYFAVIAFVKFYKLIPGKMT